MDKLYKSHFLSQLKARMPLERPEFQLRKVPKDHAHRWLFSSSLLYVQALPSGRCVWLDWAPGEGVEREFFAFLGWSCKVDQLPVNQPGDHRVHFIREPTAGFASGILNLQAVEGRNAIGGFTIATPWDELYALSPRAPDVVRKAVMAKAYAAHLALPEVERIDAVRSALDGAFSSLGKVLPGFVLALENIPGLDA